MLIRNIIGCFVYSIILTLLINYICYKINFLIYKPLEIHKDKFKSKIIISGGILTPESAAEVKLAAQSQESSEASSK